MCDKRFFFSPIMSSFGYRDWKLPEGVSGLEVSEGSRYCRKVGYVEKTEVQLMLTLAVVVFALEKLYSYLNLWGEMLLFRCDCLMGGLIGFGHCDADGVLSVRTTSKFRFLRLIVL